MKRKWLTKAALLFILCMITACGNRGTEQNEQQPENNVQTENTETESTESQNAEADSQTQQQETPSDQLAGGSTEELIYEIEYEQKQYTAEDDTVIFEAKLAYPVLIGDAENFTAINAFFERWRDEKIREYENDDDSSWRLALEVYRETRDSGWMGPWSEEYTVSSVNSQKGYVSVLLDSYLYEGGNHGMPYRESFLFRKSDGSPVDLMQESGMQEDAWEQLLESRFMQLVQEDTEGRYYSEAMELLDDVDWDEVGSYFGDAGIVFYLPPYEIGPYSSGYAEVVMTYDEILGE